MSVVNNNLLLTADAGVAPSAYQISRSLRFNSADSAYLSRTPSVAGNRTTWTWSGWVKRTMIGTATDFVFSAIVGNLSRYFYIGFIASNQIQMLSGIYTTGASTTIGARLTTTAVYRDPSSWMHLTYAHDTGNATSTERVRLYINGERLTAF